MHYSWDILSLCLGFTHVLTFAICVLCTVTWTKDYISHTNDRCPCIRLHQPSVTPRSFPIFPESPSTQLDAMIASKGYAIKYCPSITSIIFIFFYCPLFRYFCSNLVEKDRNESWDSGLLSHIHLSSAKTIELTLMLQYFWKGLHVTDTSWVMCIFNSPCYALHSIIQHSGVTLSPQSPCIQHDKYTCPTLSSQPHACVILLSGLHHSLLPLTEIQVLRTPFSFSFFFLVCIFANVGKGGNKQH